MVYVITALFILLDMITGLINAFKEKRFTSSIMREGLFHKSGSILCICFATLIDYAQKYIDLGVSIPLTIIMCGYIILMEIGSIIENLCKINPDLLSINFQSHFTKLKGKEKDVNES